MKTEKYTTDKVIAILKATIKGMMDTEQSCGELFGVIDLLEKLPSEKRIDLKSCSKCGKLWPATSKHFAHYDKAADGFKYECRICARKYMNRYKRQTRKRNAFPSGDLEEIQRHRDLAGRPREYFSQKQEPSKATMQAYALESLAP